MMKSHAAVYNLTGKLKRVLLVKPAYYKIIPLSNIARDFCDKGVKPDQNRYAEWVIQTIRDEEVELSDAVPDHSIAKADKTHKTDPDAKPARKSHTTTTLPHLDNYLMNNKHWKNIMRD